MSTYGLWGRNRLSILEWYCINNIYTSTFRMSWRFHREETVSVLENSCWISLYTSQYSGCHGDGKFLRRTDREYFREQLLDIIIHITTFRMSWRFQHRTDYEYFREQLLDIIIHITIFQHHNIQDVMEIPAENRL